VNMRPGPNGLPALPIGPACRCLHRGHEVSGVGLSTRHGNYTDLCRGFNFMAIRFLIMKCVLPAV
jgi:hypothetical protein